MQPIDKVHLMANVIAKISFPDVRISRFTDGRCWCGCEPIGVMQTFAAPAGLYRDNLTDQICQSDQGTNTDVLWNSAEIVTFRGLPVLMCENDHYFVTRSKLYAGDTK